ncbi:MAG: glycosyltransferase [Saprospiraceae bacterium]
MQGIYLYGLFRAIAKASKSQSSGSKISQDGLTILICAKNEADNLAHNLPYILAQDHPKLEVLIINDGSTDNSAAILAQFEEEFVQLKVHFLDPATKINAGKKQALALGLRLATYNSILLTDADCVPNSQQWALKMHQRMLSGNIRASVVLGFAPNIVDDSLLGAFAAFETHLTALQYLGFAAMAQPYMGVGRNMAYTKAWISRDPNLIWKPEIASGDDDLLVQGLATSQNTQIEIDPDTWMYSPAKSDLRSWLRQKSRHLSTAVVYDTKAKSLLSIFPLLQGLSWIAIVIVLFSASLSSFAAVLSFRWIVLSLALRPSFKRFKFRRGILWIPTFDFSLSLYYLFVAGALALPRKQQWGK